jgi:hypothetical protein
MPNFFLPISILIESVPETKVKLSPLLRFKIPVYVVCARAVLLKKRQIRMV